MAFTPAGTSHAVHYKQAVPIKVTHNNKGPLITCTASSFLLKAAFDPPLLDLGAILPRFDGQQPNQALLKLSNPFGVDMEVMFVNRLFAPLVWSWSIQQRNDQDLGETCAILNRPYENNQLDAEQHDAAVMTML